MGPWVLLAEGACGAVSTFGTLGACRAAVPVGLGVPRGLGVPVGAPQGCRWNCGCLWD